MASEQNLTSRFRGKKVAVIGDLVADQYLNGSIARVSREAPVFILRHDETKTLPGAAANAAANVASLGGTPLVAGLIGTDANGDALASALENAGVSTAGVVRSAETTTTTKVRVLAAQQHAARQQVIRIDYEPEGSLSTALSAELIARVEACCRQADAIVVSDYNYGVATSAVYERIRSIAAETGSPVIIDSRFRLEDFSGATSATPNADEAEQILGRGFTDDDCAELCRRLGFRSLVITNGPKGMTVFQPDSPAVSIAAVGSSQAVDVTGAGDTVIATYALGLASGLDFIEAARIANHAGGIVVMKKGTAVVTGAELEASLASDGKAIPSFS